MNMLCYLFKKKFVYNWIYSQIIKWGACLLPEYLIESHLAESVDENLIKLVPVRQGNED